MTVNVSLPKTLATKIDLKDLSEKVKNKDRDTVRHYPKMLGRAGYRIVHSPTP